MRGKLLHLSVADHYVNVRTDRGEATLLMRFSDVLAEIEGAEGLQVHRSHWVAEVAVAGSVRENGRLFLNLHDGARVPVSRTFLPEVEARGLLSPDRRNGAMQGDKIVRSVAPDGEVRAQGTMRDDGGSRPDETPQA